MAADEGMDWGSAQVGAGPESYQRFMGPGMFGPFAERLVDDVGLKPGMRVLDIACGTGVVSRAAARRVGPDGSVTGVDLGVPMLEVARAQATDEGAAAIDYLEGSADALPVDGGAFDAVTCQQGLQFFPDRPAAVAEMKRALRAGGRVGIATWAEIQRQPVLNLIVQGLAAHIGDEAGNQMRSPFSLPDPEELRAIVEGAGFTEVEVSELTLDTTFPSATEAARTIVLANPVGPTFSAATADAQEAFERAVTESLADYATDDGGLRAPMTTQVALGVNP